MRTTCELLWSPSLSEDADDINWRLGELGFPTRWRLEGRMGCWLKGRSVWRLAGRELSWLGWVWIGRSVRWICRGVSGSAWRLLVIGGWLLRGPGDRIAEGTAKLRAKFKYFNLSSSQEVKFGLYFLLVTENPPQNLNHRHSHWYAPDGLEYWQN